MTKQTDLLEPSSDTRIVPAVADIAPVEQLPAIAQSFTEPSVSSDLRAGLMTLPRKEQAVVAAEYIDRRKAFRDWLKSQLVEGVHFGYPPGIAPKFDKDGNMISKSKDRQTGEWKETKVSPKSWTAKPSLYKAGADFVCDLLVVRDEYAADMDGWQQLGSPKGVFVYACRLLSRSNSELLGEGRGVRAVGQKGGDENNAIKMAKKSAKVDAVLNAFGLSDLFTQDAEDIKPHESATQKAGAPQAAPRGEEPPKPEVTGAMLKRLCEEWTEPVGNGTFRIADFTVWCHKKLPDAPTSFDPMKPETWTTLQYDACLGALGL